MVVRQSELLRFSSRVATLKSLMAVASIYLRLLQKYFEKLRAIFRQSSQAGRSDPFSSSGSGPGHRTLSWETLYCFPRHEWPQELDSRRLNLRLLVLIALASGLFGAVNYAASPDASAANTSDLDFKQWSLLAIQD